MAITPNVSFRDADVYAALAERGENRHEIARRDLDRYYRLIERELDLLPFRLDEWGVLAAATISTAFDARVTAYQLAVVVEDAVALEGAADGREIDPAAFGRMLALLSPGQVMAVVDRLERRRLAHVGDRP